MAPWGATFVAEAAELVVPVATGCAAPSGLATVAVCETSVEGLAAAVVGLDCEGRPNGFATVATGAEEGGGGGGVTVADNTFAVTLGDPADVGTDCGEGLGSEATATVAVSMGLSLAGAAGFALVAALLLPVLAGSATTFAVEGATFTVIEDAGFAPDVTLESGAIFTTESIFCRGRAVSRLSRLDRHTVAGNWRSILATGTVPAPGVPIPGNTVPGCRLPSFG